MSTPVLTASETAFYPRFKLGPIRSWTHFLSDCIRQRGGLHGNALLPCCRRRELGCFRPAYALDDVHAFVNAVLATVPGAGKMNVRPTVVLIEPMLTWKASENTFEDDGSPPRSRCAPQAQAARMNGRNPKRRGIDQDRDSGPFIALPFSVVDSAAYQSLGHPARSLLIEIARQCVGDNNGRLRAGMAYLGSRGWRSADVVTRAKRELIEKGLIHEMVKGHRPNRASWYAVTWRKLHPHPGYDFGTADTFDRRAYEKWGANQNRALRPAAVSAR